MALDVVVIGAGLIGLSTADALAARGVSVTVIEARGAPVRGTSFSNSGMIHPSQFRPWGAKPSAADRDAGLAVRDLAHASLAPLRDAMTRLGLSEATARPIGCYQIFPDLDAARTAQSLLARDGVDANVVIDPDRTFSRPALYFPDDRSADAKQYGEALADDLAKRGVTFIYDAQDLRLRDGGDGAVAVALAGHRFRADHVVAAAGAQTAELLAPLGLGARITPVRGWAVDFALPKGRPLPPVPVMDSTSRSALTVFADRFRLSGTWGEDSAKPLLERWAAIMPDVVAQAGKPLSVWSGLRPVSDAGRPFIGPTPVKGLWINAGHGHLGWTLCAGSGALIADMILGGARDPRFAFAG